MFICISVVLLLLMVIMCRLGCVSVRLSVSGVM